MSKRPAVQAENLVKTYSGDVQAVKGISFEVSPGEAFGLLGPNGAGKTTTIGMLNSTVTPTSGRARLGGLDVAEDPG
ncbi:MAG TPA: ATP-binding cassette domain-containing protein [Acidimicrobiales bacterium]|nr:ATP-binding cassette domain-containing protein [Acidimicrobiales bacterium]